MAIGIAMLPIIYIHDEKLRLLAEQEEYAYMKDTYNLPDHMDEYLDYLKVNNFEEYLRLKSIHEDIHSYEIWVSIYFPISFLLMMSGLLFGICLGLSYRE